MRKEAGFEVVDRITVNYVCDDEAIDSAFNDELKGVVLADAVVKGDTDGFKKNLDINGISVDVIINKVNK